MPLQLDPKSRMGKIFQEGGGNDPGFIFPSPAGVGAVVSKHALERLLRLFKKGETKSFHIGASRPTSKSVERRVEDIDRRTRGFDRRSPRGKRPTENAQDLKARRAIDRTSLPSRIGGANLFNRRKSVDPIAVDNIGFTEKTISSDIMRFLRKGQQMDLNIRGAETSLKQLIKQGKQIKADKLTDSQLLGNRARGIDPRDVKDRLKTLLEVKGINKNILRTAAKEFKKNK